MSLMGELALEGGLQTKFFRMRSGKASKCSGTPVVPVGSWSSSEDVFRCLWLNTCLVRFSEREGGV